jgi:hypothetical protein
LNEEKIGVITVEYYPSGELRLLGWHNQHYVDGKSKILFDAVLPNSDLDPIALTRKLVSIELSWLAHKTGSAAAALDYWQTRQNGGGYKQTSWADIRGVNRQTVNDRVRDAKESIGDWE